MSTPVYKHSENLLSIGADSKTVKNRKLGFLTGILYLTPADGLSHILGRKVSLCPYVETPETHGGRVSPCVESCLYGSGSMIYRTEKMATAREDKSLFFFLERDRFYLQIEREIRSLVARAERENLLPLVRFNGTSDIAIETQRPSLFKTTAGFYDYTKSLDRMLSFLSGDFPENYDLTFSWSGENRADCETVLECGGNVSVPFFPSVPVGREFLGREIISGDETDVRLRRFDGESKVIGLRWKNTVRVLPDGTREKPIQTRDRAIERGFCVETSAVS